MTHTADKDAHVWTRRNFLGGAGALLLAPGVFLTAGAAGARAAFAAAEVSGAEQRGTRRWGLLIDTRLCTSNCRACLEQCNKEYVLLALGLPATDAHWLRKVKITDPTTGHVSYVPLMCQHCADAPCVTVCPTGATLRRQDGIVLVNRHYCIGCRYCMVACPFKARGFVNRGVLRRTPHTPRGKGTVEGCTLCAHRVDEGLLPACVEACAATGRGAMLFGDLNDPTSAIARKAVSVASVSLRADLCLDPSVRYLGVSL